MKGERERRRKRKWFLLFTLPIILSSVLSAEAVTVMHVQRKSHPPKKAELDATKRFLKSCFGVTALEEC
jgi:hypothetical protein